MKSEVVGYSKKENHILAISAEFQTCISDPEKYWNTHKEQTAIGLNDLLKEEKEPAVEIGVPVHKNYSTLPVLAATVAQSRGVQPTTRLKFLLHNPDAQSEDFVYQMKEEGLPIDVDELKDPLITGPYLSWQYLMATSLGKKYTVCLDADSAVLPEWLGTLTNLADTHSYKGFSGQRHYVDGNRITSAYKEITNTLVYPKKIKPLQSPHYFVAGNSLVRTEDAKRIIHTMLGYPVGDGHFARNLLLERPDGLALVNAPLLSSGDKFNDLTAREWTDKLLIQTIQRFPHFLQPTFIQYYADTKYLARTISRYTPWTRNIISYWIQKGQLSNKDVYSLFEETATEQGFAGNEHVEKMLRDQSLDLKPQIDSPADVMGVLFNIAEQTTRPTMQDKIQEKDF